MLGETAPIQSGSLLGEQESCRGQDKGTADLRNSNTEGDLFHSRLRFTCLVFYAFSSGQICPAHQKSRSSSCVCPSTVRVVCSRRMRQFDLKLFNVLHTVDRKRSCYFDWAPTSWWIATVPKYLPLQTVCPTADWPISHEVKVSKFYL